MIASPLEDYVLALLEHESGPHPEEEFWKWLHFIGKRANARGVLKTTVDLKLDCFVNPTWRNPQRPIGDLNTTHGDNSQFFAPS